MKKSTLTLILVLLLSTFITLTNAAFADEGWGSLTGQVIYDGEAPKTKAIKNADPFCGKLDLKEEQFLVNADNGGLANVGVWLSVAQTDKVKPPIHADLKKLADQKVKVDNKNCRFEPHMAVIWTEQTVELTNSDATGHNMRVMPVNKANIGFSELIPQQKSKDYKFKVEETLPVKVECNIHMWMGGWLIVRGTPYAAVTDADGKFIIEKIPAGTWKFRFWQEEFGYLQDVKLGDTAQKWKRGEVQIQIKDGEKFDLGIIKAQPKKK